MKDGARVCYQADDGTLAVNDRGTIRANEPGDHLPWRVEWDDGQTMDDVGEDGRGTLPEGRVVLVAEEDTSNA